MTALLGVEDMILVILADEKTSGDPGIETKGIWELVKGAKRAKRAKREKSSGAPGQMATL